METFVYENSEIPPLETILGGGGSSAEDTNIKDLHEEVSKLLGGHYEKTGGRDENKKIAKEAEEPALFGLAAKAPNADGDFDINSALV